MNSRGKASLLIHTVSMPTPTHMIEAITGLLDTHAEEARADQRDFLNKMQRLPNVDDIYDEEYLQQRLEEQREICGRAVFKLIMQDGLNPTRPDIAKAVCLNATIGEGDIP